MGQIIMLGTGDPLNDERVQTSLAVPLNRDETLLIDTTSGTALLGQLRAARRELSGIHHLFVSHRHFDHAGGLAPLLTAMAGLPAARLTIYASPATIEALHALLDLTIPGVEDWMGARLEWQALREGAAVEIDGVSITPFAVDHAVACSGFLLVLDGATAVFSADTRPCANLVAYARGADLLIHEAYGLAATAADAHLYGHSTAAEAGAAARAAGVQRLWLTHLRAGRFADPAALAAEAAEMFGQPVEVAHDLDVIDL